MDLGKNGILAGVRYAASPNCDDRPAGERVYLLVVHAISLPPANFAGDCVERFFTNRLDADADPYFGQIRGLKVSAHFFVRRNGELMQFVPVGRRAWHAGASVWRGRGNCNDFSVGVELEGTDQHSFEPVQYRRLVELVGTLLTVLPLTDIAAHSDVAPSRKTDPGPKFDWLHCLGLFARD
ncbi:MAG: 1,6-anhydro-N-acetylmuramyl-L-alanine amidase AmpD [Betaproteobacteria bacterium]|nr:1,6-anhydro-N-acetylmuramyl-L-alanine amidase AmpD [Betaproteobacteria bacterium]